MCSQSKFSITLQFCIDNSNVDNLNIDCGLFQIPSGKPARTPAGPRVEDLSRSKAMLCPARTGRCRRTTPGRNQPKRAQSFHVEGHASEKVCVLVAPILRKF